MTLETLKAFIAFCQANNLKYYAAYGTVLGAARHHGFIPWDDDIDVYMMRDDYDRYLRLMRTNPPKGYEQVEYVHDKEYYLPFAKFCNAHSTIANGPNTASVSAITSTCSHSMWCPMTTTSANATATAC